LESSYSYVTLPKDATNLPPNLKEIPAHWKVMALPVEPPEKGFADFHDITIANVEVKGARRILSASGLPGKLLGDVRWENITAYGRQAGAIEYARDWTMKNVRFITDGWRAGQRDQQRERRRARGGEGGTRAGGEAVDAALPVNIPDDSSRG
jgi:hypothetical protein